MEHTHPVSESSADNTVKRPVAAHDPSTSETSTQAQSTGGKRRATGETDNRDLIRKLEYEKRRHLADFRLAQTRVENLELTVKRQMQMIEEWTRGTTGQETDGDPVVQRLLQEQVSELQNVLDNAEARSNQRLADKEQELRMQANKWAEERHQQFQASLLEKHNEMFLKFLELEKNFEVKLSENQATMQSRLIEKEKSMNSKLDEREAFWKNRLAEYEKAQQESEHANRQIRQRYEQLASERREDRPTKPPQSSAPNRSSKILRRTQFMNNESVLNKLPPLRVPPSFASSSNPSDAQNPTSDVSDEEISDAKMLQRLAVRLGLRLGSTSESQAGYKKKSFNAIREEEALLEPGENQAINRLVLHVWKTAFGVNTVQEFILYEAANDATVEDYNNKEVGNGPVDSMRLYFGPEYAKSPWNEQIIQYLIGEYRHFRAQPLWATTPNANVKVLHSRFQCKLKESRVQWSKGQCRVIDGKTETEEEAQQRLEADLRKTQISTIRRSRKQRRFDERKDTMLQMIKISETDTRFDNDVFKYLLDVVELLGVDGQSSDEEDKQVIDGIPYPVFVAKKYVWRSEDVTSYLKLIDRLRTDFVKMPGGRGRVPRSRNYRTESADPVTGLPRAMYNEKWLKGKEEETQHLVQPPP